MWADRHHSWLCGQFFVLWDFRIVVILGCWVVIASSSSQSLWQPKNVPQVSKHPWLEIYRSALRQDNELLNARVKGQDAIRFSCVDYFCFYFSTFFRKTHCKYAFLHSVYNTSLSTNCGEFSVELIHSSSRHPLYAALISVIAVYNYVYGRFGWNLGAPVGSTNIWNDFQKFWIN